MSYTPLANILLSGDPRATTPTAGDNDTSIATTAFVQGELGDYLPLAGGTMTGDITLGSGVDINFNDTNSGLQWSDVRLSRTAANIIALASGDKIQQNAAPTVGDDLVNKTYADSLATGLDLKASVRVATAAALPAYTRTGNVIEANANGALPSIDGVTLVLGDRLLLKDGAAGADNGIYEVTAVGDGSNPFELTRTSDADNSPAGEVTAGMYTFVEEGTANGDEGWVLTTNNPITLNTTALTFSQFSSAVVVTTLDSLTDVDTSGVVDGSLLRYEATGTQWNDTSTLLYTDAGQLQATTTGSGGGILIGGDTQLYRSAADFLSLGASDTLRLDGGDVFIENDGLVEVQTSVVTSWIMQSSLGTDSNARFAIDAQGDMYFGDGTAAPDKIIDFDPTTYNVTFTNNAGSYIFDTGVTSNADVTLNASDLITIDGSAQLRNTGDVDNRILIDSVPAKPIISFGDGTNAPDTNLYRDAANTLKTDDALDVAGRLIAEAGQRVAVSSVKTSAYTVAPATDYIVRVDSSGGAFTVTLPASHTSGDMVVIKDVAGSAGTNNVTIDPADADTIDGAASVALTVNYQALSFVSNGTNWFIV